jgi:hypothetical protein
MRSGRAQLGIDGAVSFSLLISTAWRTEAEPWKQVDSLECAACQRFGGRDQSRLLKKAATGRRTPKPHLHRAKAAVLMRNETNFKLNQYYLPGLFDIGLDPHV